MTERSEKLARYIREAKESKSKKQSQSKKDQAEKNGKAHPQPNHNGNPNEKQDDDALLEKGFAQLKNNLAREFHNQIEDVNGEPGCMQTLGSRFDDEDSCVFKLDAEEKGLKVEFHPDEHSVEIKGQQPVEFYYFIQVKLNPECGKWAYVGGADKNKLEIITGNLDEVVSKSIFALFGVEA
jgi:hypothetical protein